MSSLYTISVIQHNITVSNSRNDAVRATEQSLYPPNISHNNQDNSLLVITANIVTDTNKVEFS